MDFKFEGDIFSVREGEIVFPYEPLLRVEGSIVETQVLETLVLNQLNFQSSIATKAARIKIASGNAKLFEFGLRRAPGRSAILGSRAAVIGGFDSTSNVEASQKYNLPAGGTMAHSWVQFFNDELEAFRKFAEFQPSTTILLVDTYDTLKQGVPYAITIAKEMEEKGQNLLGIRIDSGDLYGLSREARKMFDQANLNYVKIFVSDQLDEFEISKLKKQDAPIDGFGVGTAVFSAQANAVVNGVYKLAEAAGRPTLKFTENEEKSTLPGRKDLFRYYSEDEQSFYCDAIEKSGHHIPNRIQLFNKEEHYLDIPSANYEKLTQQVMKNGKFMRSAMPIAKIANYTAKRIQMLPEIIKHFKHPGEYIVGTGRVLNKLNTELKTKLWTH